MRGVLGLAAGLAAIVFAVAAGNAAQDTAKPHARPQAVVGYGAIAYDEYAGKKGAAFDQPSEATAKSAALKQCGSKGCQVHAVQPHYCAALARSDKDRAWGGAERESLEDATSEAVAHCQTHTKEGKCEVQLSGCNK